MGDNYRLVTVILRSGQKLFQSLLVRIREQVSCLALAYQNHPMQPYYSYWRSTYSQSPFATARAGIVSQQETLSAEVHDIPLDFICVILLPTPRPHLRITAIFIYLFFKISVGNRNGSFLVKGRAGMEAWNSTKVMTPACSDLVQPPHRKWNGSFKCWFWASFWSEHWLDQVSKNDHCTMFSLYSMLEWFNLKRSVQLVDGILHGQSYYHIAGIFNQCAMSHWRATSDTQVCYGVWKIYLLNTTFTRI